MDSSPQERRALHIRHDLSTGLYELTGWGARHQVRPWTWGERRRLLAQHTGAHGLDRAGFVVALLGLLMTPVPAEPLWPLYAHVVLSLMGIRPGQPPASLTDTEVLVARHMGWGPRELDAQPAPAIDRIASRLRQLAGGAAPARAPDPNWNRIVFDESHD